MDAFRCIVASLQTPRNHSLLMIDVTISTSAMLVGYAVEIMVSNLIQECLGRVRTKAL
jgi:hypothetical protein